MTHLLLVRMGTTPSEGQECEFVASELIQAPSMEREWVANNVWRAAAEAHNHILVSSIKDLRYAPPTGVADRDAPPSVEPEELTPLFAFVRYPNPNGPGHQDLGVDYKKDPPEFFGVDLSLAPPPE